MTAPRKSSKGLPRISTREARCREVVLDIANLLGVPLPNRVAGRGAEEEWEVLAMAVRERVKELKR